MGHVQSLTRACASAHGPRSVLDTSVCVDADGILGFEQGVCFEFFAGAGFGPDPGCARRTERGWNADRARHGSGVHGGLPPRGRCSRGSAHERGPRPGSQGWASASMSWSNGSSWPSWSAGVPDQGPVSTVRASPRCRAISPAPGSSGQGRGRDTVAPPRKPVHAVPKPGRNEPCPSGLDGNSRSGR